MTLREKFGRLVLLEETDSGPLGNEYRAARLGPSGFDRLVTLLRFSPAVSAHAEASKRLVEEARLASQIHNPGIVRVLGVGRVGTSFYLSTELVEGRTLRAVLSHCREDGFPFGADHALMIASRAAAGLELLHARKDEGGRPLLHGLVSQRQLVVAFDGEVKLKGLGLWSALADTGLLAPEERSYLAPEQNESRGDPRSDVYALGLVLLESLRGQAMSGNDPLEGLAEARLAGPGGEAQPLPRPLADLLRRALAKDPAARFAGMAELRRAIDALLFSGDFTPTTFDLAFFMHTVFRDAVERDARAIDDARAGDYREFLAEDGAKGAAVASARTEPVDAAAPKPAADALAALPTEVGPPTLPGPTVPEPRPSSPAAAAPAARPAAAQGPDSSQSRLSARVREAAAREAAGRLSLGGGAAAPRAGMSRSLGLGLGLVAAVVVGGGAGWLYFVTARRGPTAPVASAEEAAAAARVKELEARIAQLEREKAAAEARAADEARVAVEQQAAAGGQPVDPAAIERAQQEARRRTREEQERAQQQELERIAEQKRIEERRLAAAAAATPAPTPAATPSPTPVPTATPTPTATAAAELGPASGVATGAVPAPPVQVALPPASQTAAPTPLAATPTPLAATPTPLAATPTHAPVAPVATAPSPALRTAPADPGDPAVRPPGLVSEDPVPYPRRAAAARITAPIVVVVRALVDENGRVAEAVVAQPSGQPADYGFDEAALKRVRSRKYRPARRHDVAVPIWVIIRVEFRPPPSR